MILLIPAFDEESSLEAVLRSVAEHAPGAEVVVVDDGSRDATAAVAARAGARVLRHPFNLGYGAALQTGYKYALSRDADLLVQMDADGQHDPALIPDLTGPVLRDECDLVIGSRFLGVGDYRMGVTRTLGRKLFESIGRVLGVRITDPTSGFQALGSRALRLYAEDFFPSDYPDVDVLVAATRRGLRIREVPVPMRESPRASTLHGGSRTFYYVYKMLLSTWAASRWQGDRS